MSAQESLELAPGPRPGTFVDRNGRVYTPPEGWACLPPGDAGLTRRVKKAGPSWTVKEKKGRKMFSRGVWAPAENIEVARGALALERQDPKYQRKLEQGRARREKAQVEYVAEFQEHVLAFLNFAPRYADMGQRLARVVAEHATPVGSGTVARTQRIPVERRAEAAVIAWMRHQTTAYDDMVVPRVKGARRELRRQLAARSRRLLDAYRSGKPVYPGTCPLQKALFGNEVDPEVFREQATP